MSFKPESAESINESELVTKAQNELDAFGHTGDPVVKLRLLCLTRGATGILLLCKMLRRLDKRETRELTIDEFTLGLQKAGFSISKEDTKVLFDRFDAGGYGKINLDDFINEVRPPMSESRLKIVHQAFEKLDRKGEGVVSVQDLKHVYNVCSNTRYQAGEDSKENILEKFLAHFDDQDPYQVTYEEFLNYYSGISASIDNDCYFDLTMRQAYKL